MVAIFYNNSNLKNVVQNCLEPLLLNQYLPFPLLRYHLTIVSPSARQNLSNIFFYFLNALSTLEIILFRTLPVMTSRSHWNEIAVPLISGPLKGLVRDQPVLLHPIWFLRLPSVPFPHVHGDGTRTQRTARCSYQRGGHWVSPFFRLKTANAASWTQRAVMAPWRVQRESTQFCLPWKHRFHFLYWPCWVFVLFLFFFSKRFIRALNNFVLLLTYIKRLSLQRKYRR